MNNIHRLKIHLANEGWTVEDKITSQGWGDSIGYSVWVKRWDWHGRAIDVQFNRHVSNAGIETEVENALQELLCITREAWNKFPDSIPEECGKGTLVKKNLILPFSELRLLKGRNQILYDRKVATQGLKELINMDKIKTNNRRLISDENSNEQNADYER